MNLKKLFSIEFFLLLVIPVIYIISWRSFVLSTILSLTVIIIAFFLFHKTHDIIIFTLGTVLGGIGEICVVYFGVWEYSEPHFLGIPLWLSLFWGYTFLLIRRLGFKILNREDIKIPELKKGLKQYILLFITYLSLMFIPSLLFNFNIAVFIGLFIVSAVNLYKGGSEDLYFALTFISLGIPLELISVYVGIWEYANPDLLGIPIWLILLYSGFALFIKKTAEIITEQFRKKLNTGNL